MSRKDKSDLTDEFNSSVTGTREVLITSYAVAATGINWHHACDNEVLFTDAPSDAVELQAIGRVKRLGQRKAMRIFKLYRDSEWATARHKRKLMAATPGMVTKLNTSFSDGQSQGVVNLG